MLFGLKAPGFKATSAADRYDTAAYETFCREIAREVSQCRYIYIALRNVMNSEHHTISGDYNMVKVSEVEELMARNEKGELER